MTKTILPVKPVSQLFPIPMVMGCEGVAAAMLLQYNQHRIKATEIMKHWPKHTSNTEKGYVGHHFLVHFGVHQTIFPDAYVPYLQQYDDKIVDGTGTDLKDLEKLIDRNQPVLVYHTVFGQNPISRTFKIEQIKRRFVSNIHVVLLIGYDDAHYYYVDPLWMHVSRRIAIPAFIPSRYQIMKISKAKMEKSYNAPGKKCIYIDK